MVADRSGFITLATGDMKRTKRSGPKTEPWGTPVDIVVQDDDDESILTKDVRFVRLERIQEMTKLDRPKVCSMYCATEINSIQLHDSFVMAPLESISLHLHFIICICKDVRTVYRMYACFIERNNWLIVRHTSRILLEGAIRNSIQTL